MAYGDGVTGVSSDGVCGAGWLRKGRAVWVWAARMDGEEQGAGKVGLCKAGVVGRQGWMCGAGVRGTVVAHKVV